MITEADLQKFRTRTEALLRETGGALPPHQCAEIKMLVHDMEVYQAELENQNEELRRTQTQLAQLRDRYTDLYDFAPIGYFTLDPEGIVTEANLAVSEMLQLARAMIKGRAFFRHLMYEDRTAFDGFFRAALAQDGRQQCTVRLKRGKPWERTILRLDGLRSVHMGSVTGVRITATDISVLHSAQQQAEELNRNLEVRVEKRTRESEERASQLRSLANELIRTEHSERKRFAQELHDNLAQLLVAAMMKVGTVQEDVSREDCMAVLGDVGALLKDASVFVRGFITELNPAALRDKEIMAALQQVARDMAKHGLEVYCYFAGHVRVSEETAVILHQCVRELLFNVIKHAHTNEAWLSLRQLDDTAIITIRDHGLGMDTDEVANFQKTDGHFGLRSVAERIEALGGTLAIESTKGAGTVATVTIPATGKGKLDNRLAPRLEIPDIEKESPLRVLLVDDHTTVRDGMKYRIALHPKLQLVGEAEDGIDALKRARELHPDIVIMDINMPRMDGIEATRRLKEELPDTVVLGLSIREDDAAIREICAAGAIALLPKTRLSEELAGALDFAVSAWVRNQ